VPLTHDSETWQKSLAALPVVTYGPDETIVTEGTTTGQLLILKSGTVSIVRGGIELVTVTEPGAVFGELSVLLHQPHTADVRTLETSEFHVADASTLLNEDPVALLYVATRLARRLDDTNPAFVELKNQIDTGQPQGLIDQTIDRIQGLLGAIGDGYIRAGAGLSMFPPE
jgi:CRP-like cAMP-binding protein